MEFEHLFAENGIEETDVAAMQTYPCHSHRNPQAANNFVYSSYVPTALADPSSYGLPNPINCNKCQHRQDKKSSAVSRTEGYRHKRALCLDRDASTKCERKCAKPKRSRIINEPQADNCSIAGPSRLIDRPVGYRLGFFNLYFS